MGQDERWIEKKENNKDCPSGVNNKIAVRQPRCPPWGKRFVGGEDDFHSEQQKGYRKQSHHGHIAKASHFNFNPFEC